MDTHVYAADKILQAHLESQENEKCLQDLQQQVNELEFYSRTQDEVNQSPDKEEIIRVSELIVLSDSCRFVMVIQ